VGIAFTLLRTALRPKTIDARDINTRPSLPTTGSQDTQQNEQDDNMSDNGQALGHPMTVSSHNGKYWSVLK
jgi:hypothetical protein